MPFSRRFFSRRSFLQLSSAAALAPLFPRLTWCVNKRLAIEASVGNSSANTRSANSGADSSTAALCRKLAADPLRPQYHLLPDHNWMNDPNGPIFFRGRYHMFHQYNPQGAVWGNMNWAHATSPDMIHWQHEPIAISPTPNGPDRDGVFSGSAILDNGTPTMIYTAVAPPPSDAEATLRDGAHTWRETQCLAVAQDDDDDLRTWKKLPEPVIATPPAGLAVTGFRDPYVWREGDKWMLTLGSGIRGKGGMVLLYTSTDLRRWTYLHPLVEGSASNTKTVNPVDTGDMWECPDFFPLGDKHVLLISTMGKVHWKVGTYANQRFTPEKEGVVDWGAYYAAKTMLDRDGNRILWGWITETRPDADLIAAGWAGAMSLPRVLSLSAQNELQTEPAPAVRKLRTTHSGIHTLGAMRQKTLDTLRIHDLAAELDLHLQPKTDEFTLRLQSDIGDFVTISCANKSGSRDLRVNTVTAPLPGPAGSPVHLHLFLDGSVLEVFANEATALTARIYQIPSGPLRLELEGNAELASLDAWQMNPISKDRLTSPLCA
ncbi:MAG TPA: glycoside hydrolase family 32 protein [Candidatus Sulfotelmatobacter sp.]|nr:glycoside hydrolase family 32 protein [Candidatus Sulfotelmatobacter sp.]